MEIDALYVSRLANVRYLSGFSGSNGHLLVTAADGCLLTDGRYTTQAEREAPDLRRITYASDLPGALADAARSIGAARIGFETDALSVQSHVDLSAAGLDLVPTRGSVEALRAFKADDEIASIRAAQAVTDEAFAAVVPTLTAGITEPRGRARARGGDAAFRAPTAWRSTRSSVSVREPPSRTTGRIDGPSLGATW